MKWEKRNNSPPLASSFLWSHTSRLRKPCRSQSPSQQRPRYFPCYSWWIVRWARCLRVGVTSDEKDREMCTRNKTPCPRAASVSGEMPERAASSGENPRGRGGEKEGKGRWDREQPVRSGECRVLTTVARIAQSGLLPGLSSLLAYPTWLCSKMKMARVWNSINAWLVEIIISFRDVPLHLIGKVITLHNLLLFLIKVFHVIHPPDV